MNEVWEYIREFTTDWVALMGGIVSVCLAVFTAIQDKPLPRNALWFGSVVCFLLSSFRVWRNKHHEFLVQRTMNTSDERQKREIEYQTAQEELVRLRRENRQATELKKMERLDERVLECIKGEFEELTNIGMLPASMAIVYQNDWFKNVGKRLHVDTDEVKEAFARLKAAGKLQSLNW